MIITAPKSYEYHGDLPDGTMLFSSKKYSVAITLSTYEQIVSVNRRGISRIKEVGAVAEQLLLPDLPRNWIFLIWRK